MNDLELLELLEDVVCDENLSLDRRSGDQGPDSYSCPCCSSYAFEDDRFGEDTGLGGIVHDEECLLDRLVSAVNRRMRGDHDAPADEEVIELLVETVAEGAINLQPHTHPNGADSMHCRGCSGWTTVKGHAWHGTPAEVSHDDDCKLVKLIAAVTERNSEDS